MTTEARVKLPEATEATEPPVPQRKKAPPKRVILAMDDAPQDGKPVVLVGEGVECEAIWRHTRFFSRQELRWVEKTFWARRNSGGQAVDFTPTGWRYIEYDQ